MIKQLAKFGKVMENAPLKEHNTYQIESVAKYLCFPESISDLKELLAFIKKNNLKFFILGNGSNIILADDYYDGVFIKLTSLNNLEIYDVRDTLFAEAGVLLPNLVAETVNHNLKGLEFAAGIPGTVGGAIYGNAGAYNSSIMDFVVSVTAIDQDLNIIRIPKDQITYSYRDSSFKKNKALIIVAAEFALAKGTKEASLELMADRLNRRRESQPLEYPSAGSVFRNPENDYAGHLIEICGLKGYQIGGAQVSNKHANFIVNAGNAQNEDLVALINKVHDEVLNKEKVDLIIEQEFIRWQE